MKSDEFLENGGVGVAADIEDYLKLSRFAPAFIQNVPLVTRNSAPRS
jgi:hypothetical protein